MTGQKLRPIQESAPGLIWATSWENLFYAYANNKDVDQPAHPLYLLYPKFQDTSWSLSRPVWVLPGHKPRRQDFSWRGSYCLVVFQLTSRWYISQCDRPPQLGKSNLFLCIRNSETYNIRSMTNPTKWHVRLAKTQISLGIRPVSSYPSLCAQWVAKDPSFLHADSEDCDHQTGRMRRLIWVFTGRTCHLVGFVMRRLKYVVLKG